MSGDVQPRKRKDKKRRRDDEDIKEIHHGVHATKMGTDDVHLHVQTEQHTGGHWCAKIFFFSLLAILLGLIGLIILENRGLSDYTPLSKSRFSEYLEGWVDENRESHDDEHVHKIEDAINEHDEPYEEEDEADEAALDEEHDNEDNAPEISEDIEDHEDDNENQEDENEAENELDNEEEEDEEDEPMQDDEEEPEEEIVEKSSFRTLKNQPHERYVNEEDDEDEEEILGQLNSKWESSKDDDDDQDDNDEQNNLDNNDQDNDNEDKRNDYNDKLQSFEPLHEEDDFDDGDEPFTDNIIDNDDDEAFQSEEQLKEEELNTDNQSNNEVEEPATSSIAVKIGVGLALVFVARLVLIKKTIPDNNQKENTDVEVLGKRNLYNADIIKRSLVTSERTKAVKDIFENLDEVDQRDTLDEEVIQPISKELAKENKLGELKRKLEQLENKLEAKSSFENTTDLNRKKSETFFEKSSNSLVEVPVPPIETKTKEEQREIKMDGQKQTISEIMDTNEEELQDYVYITDERIDEREDGADGDDEEYEDDDEPDEVDDDYDGEISDVDDDDLMKRLEAKYGKLEHSLYDKDEEDEEEHEDDHIAWTRSRPSGANSFSEDAYIDNELNRANEQLLQNNLKLALKIYESLLLKHPLLPEALSGKAATLDKLSEKYMSNELLKEALQSYETFLTLGNNINDALFKKNALRCIERRRFLGNYFETIKMHKILINRFPNEPHFWTEWVITNLLFNRLAEAKEILERTLAKWSNDGVAMVLYGFVLKNHDQNFEQAIRYLQKGIASEANGTQDGRFYFSLGDSLQRLGRTEEAMEVYRKGARRKLFLSEYQRSLYNIETLKAQPFWTKKETTYASYFDHLEENFPKIRSEALKIVNEKGYFLDESESLRDFGDWKQFELFARGHKNIKNCQKAPFTCGLIENFPAARFCKRGQVKFSIMQPGTHVWPHCGPTNCRLRAHLGLKIPSGTIIRVAKQNRTWVEGETLIFDDSFEHEVWHTGSSYRLVLIVDVWHPEITDAQKRTLSEI